MQLTKLRVNPSERVAHRLTLMRSAFLGILSSTPPALTARVYALKKAHGESDAEFLARQVFLALQHPGPLRQQIQRRTRE